jgi:hypothetical protein
MYVNTSVMGNAAFTTMPEVKVNIVEYLDDSQPGWVKAILKDASGQEWTIEDKVPIFTERFLDRNSDYPQEGLLACTILETVDYASNGKVFRIEISNPVAVEEINGKTIFEVSEEQLIR